MAADPRRGIGSGAQLSLVPGRRQWQNSLARAVTISLLCAERVSQEQELQSVRTICGSRRAVTQSCECAAVCAAGARPHAARSAGFAGAGAAKRENLLSFQGCFHRRKSISSSRSRAEMRGERAWAGNGGALANVKSAGISRGGPAPGARIPAAEGPGQPRASGLPRGSRSHQLPLHAGF